jgi:hypothetical protein
MITFKKKDKTECSCSSVKELFDGSRGLRSELFGCYVTTGDIKGVKLLEKIDEKIEIYKLYLSNLQTLRAEASKLAADEEAEKLKETVSDMSIEQVQALMEKLKSRLPE